VADAPTQDAPAGTEKIDGAIASCIRAIRGGYVLRVDGVVVLPATTNPQIIVEASTALPLTGATAVQGGTYHGCAALSNGTVECWQTNTTSGNSNGQLGNGTTTASSVVYRATPVLKSANTPLTGVVAFATGGETTNGLHSTCAVTSDGKLWCWGDLTWIVNGGTTLYTGYAQAITTDGINALAGVVQAAYTLTGACALIEGSPRTVWCWGYNASDELGQGNTTNQQYAVKVLGLTAPSQVIISNSYYSDNTPCALDGDGVKCWGNNGNATAGINATTNPVHSPTPVVLSSGTPLSGVVDLEPGTAAIGALRTDGTLWTWGYGFKSYATNYGLTNIVAVGYVGGYGGNGPRFLTSDGVYHNGSSTVPVQCTP
jgi:alpha-tubulin suppressor-like RCC1 family protein